MARCTLGLVLLIVAAAQLGEAKFDKETVGLLKRLVNAAEHNMQTRIIFTQLGSAKENELKAAADAMVNAIKAKGNQLQVSYDGPVRSAIEFLRLAVVKGSEEIKNKVQNGQLTLQGVIDYAARARRTLKSTVGSRRGVFSSLDEQRTTELQDAVQAMKNAINNKAMGTKFADNPMVVENAALECLRKSALKSARYLTGAVQSGEITLNDLERMPAKLLEEYNKANQHRQRAQVMRALVESLKQLED